MERSIDVCTSDNLMRDNQVGFLYKGPITPGLLASPGDTLGGRLHCEDCDARALRRISKSWQS